MLQSRIFTNNESSIALHKKMGFRLVGKREKILKKHGVWRDVYVYERRARIDGEVSGYGGAGEEERENREIDSGR